MKKLFIFLIVGLMVFSFASASFADKVKTPVKTPFADVESSPKDNIPTPTPIIDDDPTPLVYSSSGAKTMWVYDGNQCVKADFYTKPYISSRYSTTNVPHKVIKTYDDGSRLVQQIKSGSKATPLNPITKKYEPTPTCDTTKIVTEPLAFGWLRSY